MSGLFAEILEKHRSRFNGQFAEAKRARPGLEAEWFKAHLREVVGPLVEAVAAARPERADEAAQALYELSLDLVARDFLGPNSRYPTIVAGWTGLLRDLPDCVAEAPRLFAGAVTNALWNLAQHPGTRPAEWMQAVRELRPLARDVLDLLEAAKVAAWRAGLAHYRESALQVARQLKPPLAASALGLAETPDAIALELALARLRDDPWLDPRAALHGEGHPRRLQLVARVGAFRGFGGAFMAPPTVTCPGGKFVVSDGEGQWLMAADRFGATLHRTEAVPEAPPVASAPPYQLGPRGQVSRGGQSATFADLANAQSHAANATTLAVTTGLGHAVYLVGEV